MANVDVDCPISNLNHVLILVETVHVVVTIKSILKFKIIDEINASFETYRKSDVHVMRYTCTVIIVMITRNKFLLIVIGPSIGDMPRERFLQ